MTLYTTHLEFGKKQCQFGLVSVEASSKEEAIRITIQEARMGGWTAPVKKSVAIEIK
jgi:hypothetical protein